MTVVDLAGPGTSANRVGHKWLLIVAAVGALVAAPVLLWADVSDVARASEIRIVRLLPLTLPAVIAFALILVLERLIPADRSQPIVSKGFCQDLLWTLFATPVAIFGAFCFNEATEWVFAHPLSGARIDLEAHLPFAIVVVICFLIGDFLAWFAHYLKHRVPIFWRFHAVHHSATEINCFTDSREHLMEYFVTRSVFVLPFFVVGGDVSSTGVTVLLVRLWYSRFAHSNIRTNLGPLRHVLVTPQSHRTHHSIEERHADQNLGNVLTIWDRMFGTHVADYDCYPVTGIDDPNFPRTTDRSPTSLVGTYWQQFAYPFRHSVKRFSAR